MDTGDEKWYFTKEQLANTPSRKCGYDGDRELSCRQQAANFIQDMGQRLQVTQLCINTAIVYMHRFYVFHSFSQFHRNAMAAAALFLAAKVEEQPRKLEHVIRVAQACLHREHPPLDTKSDAYLEQAQDLVMNENVLLQTLGFDVAIDHPHTHVVRCCHLVKASKDLAQTSYFMASNSLHLTTMCLQYKPTVVACFCIHLACKWSSWEIPLSNESKSWFWYVDRSVTQELLEQLTDEFLRIFDKCPSRLKRKISSYQNMSGYHMGSNELSTKRLPGTENQQGVSFQQPINRGRQANDESRKKLGEFMQPPSHRPPVPVADFKKQPPPLPPPAQQPQPPPPTSHSISFPHSHHSVPLQGMPVRGYNMGPSTSQALSSSASHHQQSVASSQFVFPTPQVSSMPTIPLTSSMSSMPPSIPLHSGASSTIPHMSGSGMNDRAPNVPPTSKHSARSDTMFPPPKRSSHSSTRSHSAKSEPQTGAGAQPPPKNYSFPHHSSRNGTEHTSSAYRSTSEPMTQEKPYHKAANYNKTNTVSWADSGESRDRFSMSNESKQHSMEMKSSSDSKHFSDAKQSNESKHFSESKHSKATSKSTSVSGQPSNYSTGHSSRIQAPPTSMAPPIKHHCPPLPSLSTPLPPPPPPPSVTLPPPPPQTKSSSIFSPDKMTPPPLSTPPRDVKPTPLSPMLLSPLASKSGRNRTSSSSSEPELIPVMPKLEDISGFESIARGKTAIKLPSKVPEVLAHTKEKRKDSQSTTNVLKDSKPEPNKSIDLTDDVKPNVVDIIPIINLDSPVQVKREHKKKKKHKEHREHKEHKDKDREKDKEKKKDKHKEKTRDKDRDKVKEKERAREDPAPIKITIPKDKIGKIIPHPTSSKSEQSASLKIKIPKDKLIAPPPEEPKFSSLKIKISKDAIAMSHPPSSSKNTSSSSKKRDRSHRDDDEKDNSRYSHSSKHARKSNGDHRSSEGNY